MGPQSGIPTVKQEKKSPSIIEEDNKNEKKK